MIFEHGQTCLLDSHVISMLVVIATPCRIETKKRDMSRSRILFCNACIIAIKERACVVVVVAGMESPHLKQELKRASVSEEDTTTYLEEVRPTSEAFALSMDPMFDSWAFKMARRVVVAGGGSSLGGVAGVDSLASSYNGQPGRKGKREMRFMIPMDLIMHMLHHPSKTMVPEYKTTQRMIENLTGVIPSDKQQPVLSNEGGVGLRRRRRRRQLSSSSSNDLRVGIHHSSRKVNPMPGFRCLYSAIRSIPLQTLIMQIVGGTIGINGCSGDDGTLATRYFLGPSQRSACMTCMCRG